MQNAGKWSPQDSHAAEDLSSIAIAEDALHGCAVGDKGTVVVTKDGGTNWKRESIPSAETLTVVRFAGKSTRALALDARGMIFASKDGGVTWEQANHYSRSPAPIFYPLLALALVPLAFAVRRPKATPEPEQSIEDLFVSDAALSAGEAAGTQVGRLGLGLAAYLRNPKTRAPIVFSVSGPWGAGKSSVLNVLKAELEDDGHRVVSFNAWHHQNEGHLLAALLGVMHGEALPPWWHWLGLWVRVRLIWTRARRMWLRLLLGLAGGVFAVTVLGKMGLDFEGIWALDKAEHVLQLLALPAAVLPLVALWQVFTAFGVKPEKIAGNFWKKEDWAKEAVSQRAKFAEEFAEVTWALQPRTLTILIDDLDRCRPEQMLATLEVVNFLACSGQCYVGLAMEEKVVSDCIATQLEWLKETQAEAGGGAAGAVMQPRTRLWLEKLDPSAPSRRQTDQ